MNSQRSRLTKSFSALLTFERFLLGVNVSGKHATDMMLDLICFIIMNKLRSGSHRTLSLPRERLSEVKWSLSPVVSQVVLSPEGLLADVAGVRPLVRVRALVDQQVVGLGEVSSAKLTNKFLFGFGRKSPARGLSVRGEFVQLGGQFGELAGLRRILLRGRDREVGEVESGSFLVNRGHEARHGSVFWVKKMGCERKSRVKRKARVN